MTLNKIIVRKKLQEIHDNAFGAASLYTIKMDVSIMHLTGSDNYY